MDYMLLFYQNTDNIFVEI